MATLCSVCGKLMSYGTAHAAVPICRPCRATRRPGPTACPHCGDEFTPKRKSSGGWTEVCSQACNGARHRARNPDYSVIKSRSRYARERIAGLTQNQRHRILHKWRRQGRTCTWCGGACDTVDHVLPLARGGTNYEGNLTPACRPCNSSRADKTVMEWRLGKKPAYTKVRCVYRAPKEPKAPRVKPPKPTHPCPICSATTDRPTYCSTLCYREGHARKVREKYRVRVGLPSALSVPTRARVRPVL